MNANHHVALPFQYGINSSRPQTAGKNTVISTRRTSTLQMP